LRELTTVAEVRDAPTSATASPATRGTEFFDFCRAIPDDQAHAAWMVSSSR
jgi:hypothetical protein